MALSTKVARSVACHGCQQWVLRSFMTSVGGPSIIPKPTIQRRTFSTPPPRRNEARERTRQAENVEVHALNDQNVEYPPTNEEGSPETLQQTQEPYPPSGTDPRPSNEHVPWYLQIEPQSQPQENAISARQRIPDLPDHPPPILEPLLRRISVELGMDDLSILDLREIDPPPALGANLLMIIGTARSDKHLHFSADKLCRWLRTEYKLTPYADGLLGRQELKLKMRRRAKRSRLLSAVGTKNTADTELDEGIRTGWICVNLGKVEGGELPKSEQQIEREKKIVGFGTGASGSNIVVQLLTEEKRGEIELEKLWATILRMSRREQQALQEDTNSTETISKGVADSTVTAEEKEIDHEDFLSSVYRTPLDSSPSLQQSRAFT